MSFAPVIPIGGPAGLGFLDRTFDRQFAQFSRSPEIARDLAHFTEVAGGIETAADLVQDTRALRVALGAFGLEDELPKRAFIRKVLEEGTLERTSLANRLQDPAWRKFSEAMGFGDFGGLLKLTAVRERTAEQYRVRQFERAVGDRDVSMRLALNFRREIGEIANSESVDRTGWFRIMGSRPLREVVEGALGLPGQFGTMDIDQQRQELESRARRQLGEASPAVFRDPEVVEDLVRRFLVRAQIESGPSATTPGMAALTILQSSGLGGAARGNLFASNFL